MISLGDKKEDLPLARKLKLVCPHKMLQSLKEVPEQPDFNA